MSIAALHQTFDETRRLAIAGSQLAPGDFRLQKLIPVLQKSAAKAPVFGKVADAARRVVDANATEAAPALLDLGSLVLSILYTQGDVGVKGDLQRPTTIAMPLTKTQTPARMLKPVIEALATTGSGRTETVREAKTMGMFDDPRLVNHAIAALDDKYSEMAQLVESIVIGYGPSIIPLIEDRIETKGRGGDARRLRVLHALDPLKARPLVLEAFENGSKEMKLAAVSCLGDDASDLPRLMENAKAKSREVREATHERLALFDDPVVDELLVQQIRDHLDWRVARAVQNHLTPARIDRLVTTIDDAIMVLQPVMSTRTPTPKQRQSIDEKIPVLKVAWSCFDNDRDDRIQTIAARVLDDFEAWITMRGKSHSGTDWLLTVMHWTVRHGSPAMIRRVAQLHADAPAVLSPVCFAAALDSMTSKAFYEAMSGVYNAPPKATKGKKTDDAKRAIERQTALTDLFTERADNDMHYHRAGRGKMKTLNLDPRWCGDLIAAGDVHLLTQIATPKDKKALDFLADHIASRTGDERCDFSTQWILHRLARCKHSRALELTLQTIQVLSDHRRRKANQRRYYYRESAYWLGHSIAQLDKKGIAQVIATLEGAEESVVDELMPHLHIATSSSSSSP